MGREQVQVWSFGIQDDISGIDVIHNAFVNAGFDGFRVKPYTGGSIGLRVSVDDKSFTFQYCKSCTQVYRGGSFTYAAFWLAIVITLPIRSCLRC
jgi:hypothetical protein